MIEQINKAGKTKERRTGCDACVNVNGGEELAKVLFYYGLIYETDSDEQKIICPFHGDVNPSMKVNLVDGSWYCFGCGLTGYACDFVKLIEEKYNNVILNDLSAAMKLTKIVKSEKTSHINLGVRKRKPKDIKQKIIEAEDYYYNLAQNDWTECIDTHVMEVYDYMAKRGFTSKILNDIGAKYTYGKSYPIVFPMMDNDNFKGWVCRTNLKEVEKKRKYLYNEGFSRRNTLCGHYEAGKPLYIVEGYMDMVKLKMFGVKNVVAILGWKITTEQVEKLRKKNIKVVISVLDNDSYGKKGTEYLKNFFEVIRFRYLKAIKDPGDMTQELFDKMYRHTKKTYKK